MLKAAREAQELTERETADRLNWMPNYVAIIERDDYQALRSPAFARGYVKAYARLLGLDQEQVLGAFDRLRSAQGVATRKRIETRPLQLQHTGLGVVIGLTIFFLLGIALWWSQHDAEPPRVSVDRDLQNPGFAEPGGEDGENLMAGER